MNIKKCTTQLALRGQLLKIWFFKNIKLIIFTTLMTYTILAVTGVIDGFIFQHIPVIDELFQGLQDGIRNINRHNWMTIQIEVIMLFSSVTTKSKSIKLEDIHSNKLKYSLIKAGLKFDENGNIVRQNEKTEKVVKETYIESLLRGIHEFVIIVTAKIDGKVDYDNIVEENDMEDSEKVVKAVDKINPIRKILIKIKTGIIFAKDKIVFVFNLIVKKIKTKKPKKEKPHSDDVDGWGDVVIADSESITEETIEESTVEDDTIVIDENYDPVEPEKTVTVEDEVQEAPVVQEELLTTATELKQAPAQQNNASMEKNLIHSLKNRKRR